jgi:hypothetical protein
LVLRALHLFLPGFFAFLLSLLPLHRPTNHLRQGVRFHSEGCVTLQWKLAGVANDPLGASGTSLLYLCLPSIWDIAGGDRLFPNYLRALPDNNNILSRTKSIYAITRNGSKCKYVEIFTHDVGSIGAPSRRTVFVRGTSAEQ